MSAVTALHGTPGTLVGRRDRGRRHLELVRPSEPAPAAPLRITRRGRLAVTLTVAAALVVLGVGMTSMLASGTTGPAETVTVRSGQTLSEVAATYLPELSVADAVVQIQLANDLSSLHVHAGQELVIPVP